MNTIASGQWVHIALVEDFTYPPLNQFLCLYVNGLLVASNSCALRLNESGPTLPILAGSGFAGEIAEMRLWNVSLPQSEIQSNMFQVLNPTNEPGLMGYWRFTEGGGNIVHDLAGTNNGVVYGATWSSDLPNSPLQPPTITQQPTNQIVPLDATNVAFSVNVVGSAPFQFQWQLNNTNIPGATASMLVITDATPDVSGAYSVVVSNVISSVTSSNAMLNILPFLATSYNGSMVIWGTVATLAMEAGGTGPFTYQWFFNGVQIDGETNASLVLQSVQFTNAGLYSVVITSPFGSVTNTPEQLVVNPANISLGTYAGITIQGVVGYTYTIQSTTNLAATNSWFTVTNVTLQQPIQIWNDDSVDMRATPTRYYRVEPGP